MSYEMKVSQARPGLITAAIDDSGSMKTELAGTNDSLYTWTERLFGHINQELLARCTDVSGDGVVVKPRYYEYLVVYGTEPDVWGDGEMSVEQVIERYTSNGNSFGLGGKRGGTNAKLALESVFDYLSQAVTSPRFKDSTPPIVFHLTDGESGTDASAVAERIKSLRTSDGNVVMVNAYIGTETSLSYNDADDFPGYLRADEAGPGEDNIRMFEMSSVLPECIRANLIAESIFPNLRKGARAFFDVRSKEQLKKVIQVVGSIGSRADRTAM